MSLLDKIDNPQQLKNLSTNDLNKLSDDIRDFIIKNVSVTGGHLAANLGVVELTLALLYVFNPPKDKIVWDVGHQSYIYKILTGRKDKFNTLRKFGGLSGFPKSKESVYDHFDTGHSSTSISVALGFSIARDLQNKDYNVIAVIGDGALTGGLAYEGLNNAGRYDGKLIIILNDNQMSISKNVGAISRYLNLIRTRRRYFKIKKLTDNVLLRIPFAGKSLADLFHKIKGGIRYLFLPGTFFEAMGFEYYGPIDGHNISKLIEIFEIVKEIEKPVLIHVVTQKGKGYQHAEMYPEKYHGVPPFDIETGNHYNQTNHKTYSTVLGNTLIDLAKENDKIVAITAAMPEGTGLDKFAHIHPQRFFDVGIAEEHAVTFAAALAKEGMKPFVAIYSTFLQRSFDQIIHDVCIQNLNVTFCIDRAGIVGEDGETHHGSFDISYLSLIPNMTIIAPKDTDEFKYMLHFANNYKNGPLAIRYPRGYSNKIGICSKIEFGKCEIINYGCNGLIISLGKHVSILYNIIKNENLDWTLVNIRFLKPIDEAIFDLIKKYEKILIVEDNSIIGGIGDRIKSMCIEKGIYKPIKHVAIPDNFQPHGNVEEIYRLINLDYDNLKRIILEMNQN
ncbi:1-deoxy-D-xylulose-5-phosphate synthase [Caldicellulosiruptoraceae bacterium PP1]